MDTTQDNITTQAINEAAEAAKPNPLERRIDMTVAMTEIEQEVEQQLKKIARTTKMAGFRPGKVPMKMVAQMYGGQARSEALGAAIEKAFGAAVREQNLRVAGQPRIEPRKAGVENQMAFTAIFEVFPEFAIAARSKSPRSASAMPRSTRQSRYCRSSARPTPPPGVPPRRATVW
jgi:FKBP-type peptidyl-prolyl cis-trans isomerase (trigger factor)